MKAAHIRKDAYKILNHACQHSDSELNFAGKASEIVEKLHIDDNTLHLALIYLKSSGMLRDIQLDANGVLKILGIHYLAINWLADFR